MWKLISISPSSRAGKKWCAYFENKTDGKHKTIHFGAKGYEDFTQHKDTKRAELYRARHAKDLTTENSKSGLSAGALSYYVLWTSPSFSQGLKNYKNKYHL